jgi:hypothetical protein
VWIEGIVDKGKKGETKTGIHKPQQPDRQTYIFGTAPSSSSVRRAAARCSGEEPAFLAASIRSMLPDLRGLVLLLLRLETGGAVGVALGALGGYHGKPCLLRWVGFGTV